MLSVEAGNNKKEIDKINKRERQGGCLQFKDSSMTFSRPPKSRSDEYQSVTPGTIDPFPIVSGGAI